MTDEDQVQEKDRTSEQFEKLTEHNQELKAERDEAAQQAAAAKAEAEAARLEAEKYKKLYEQPTNQAPSANQFPNLNQQQVNQVFQSMVDENGFLDGGKLMTVLQQQNDQARRATEEARLAREEAAQLRKQQQDKDEKTAQAKVYDKYPQLNPDNKEQFDPKMWRAVYNELAMKAKAGENPSETDYIEAADRIYDDFYADKDMSQKTDQQKQEKIEQKQQINAVKPVSRIQSGFYEKDNDDDLLKKVQQGKRGALAEMLKRIGQ